MTPAILLAMAVTSGLTLRRTAKRLRVEATRSDGVAAYFLLAFTVFFTGMTIIFSAHSVGKIVVSSIHLFK